MSSQPQTDRLIGQKIKGYQITERLGSGGMGSVYRAVHTLLHKNIAIKTLHQEFSRRPEIVARFFQEARAASDIRHENVIDIIDFEENDLGHFILMEYLQGQSLFELIEAHAPLPPGRICHITKQICAALGAAHQKGIIHRDLKSDNVFLIERSGQKDFVKILDFGIAKLLLDSSIKTQTGHILGTPTYLAPEQIQGATVDARTDIYALGVLLYEMITRVPPFANPNPVVLLGMHAYKPPAPPESKNPRTPKALSEIILRCLAKKKEERFASMAEVASALTAVPDAPAAPVKRSPYPNSRPSQRNAVVEARPAPTRDMMAETTQTGASLKDTLPPDDDDAPAVTLSEISEEDEPTRQGPEPELLLLDAPAPTFGGWYGESEVDLSPAALSQEETLQPEAPHTVEKTGKLPAASVEETGKMPLPPLARPARSRQDDPLLKTTPQGRAASPFTSAVTEPEESGRLREALREAKALIAQQKTAQLEAPDISALLNAPTDKGEAVPAAPASELSSKRLLGLLLGLLVVVGAVLAWFFS